MTHSEVPGKNKSLSSSAISRRDRVIDRAFSSKEPLPEIITCNPQGQNDNKLAGFLSEVEVYAKTVARYSRYNVIIGMIDKARQNPINHIGTERGAGDRSLEAYWDLARKCTQVVASRKESKWTTANVARVSPSSDEAVIVITGTDLTRRSPFWFMAAWEKLRKLEDYRKYDYKVCVMDREFNQDLYGFSQILTNPEMIVSCHREFMGPIAIKKDSKEHDLADILRRLELKEIKFKSKMPKRLRGNGGLAEVNSPFSFNISNGNQQVLSSGTLVEIKLRANGQDADALQKFLENTRKGYREIHSRLFGMRGFNTFFGKAICNKLLTPITHAMYELEATAIPLRSGYLTYWIDAPISEALERQIKDAISQKKEQYRNPYAELLGKPCVSMMDARGINISEVRSLFILQSLDKDLSPEYLYQTDFLINFIENVNISVQKRIFDEIGISRLDRRYINSVYDICSSRRTIRDTEDFIWVVRKDSELKERNIDIGFLEDWIFIFASKHFEKIKYSLYEKIERLRF